MLVIGLACVFCYRSFCRFICPLGAIYGLFNRFALTGVKVDTERCNGCGACVRSCQMDVRYVGDHECISCGKCMNACARGAISLKCGSITLSKCPSREDAVSEAEANTKFRQTGRQGKRRAGIAWGIALAVLVVAFAWFNGIAPEEAQQSAGAAETETAEAFDSSLPTGTEVGCVLPDFTTDLVDGETFHLADTRGKVVFINTWGNHMRTLHRRNAVF